MNTLFSFTLHFSVCKVKGDNGNRGLPLSVTSIFLLKNLATLI